MHPKTLTLLVTYQCTAACAQCCFGCTPKKKQRILQDRILGYIDQAAALGHIVNVVFSGGECFLLGDDLVEAVARATTHGLATRCVTNGYWATSLAAARRRLEPLVAAGLRELNFSTGDLHREYVPVERITAGAIIAYELGLGLSLVVETRAERSLTRAALLENAVLAEIHREDPDGMRIHENVWIPMDRDCTIAHDKVHFRNRTNPQLMRGCDTVLAEHGHHPRSGVRRVLPPFAARATRGSVHAIETTHPATASGLHIRIVYLTTSAPICRCPS